MQKKLLAIIVFIFIIIGQINAADVDDIIKNVQKKYDKMKNLSATFRQVETFKLTGSQTETIGKIYISQGVKYRFESEDQIVVTDGKTIWTYNDLSKQLLIDNVRENSGALLPRDLLFKFPKDYYATLLGEEKVSGKTIYLLKLDPRENVYGYIKSVKLWVEKNKWHILKLETTDLNGNQSLFEITDIDTKTKLNDNLFSFEAGEDIEVVDMR